MSSANRALPPTPAGHHELTAVQRVAWVGRQRIGAVRAEIGAVRLHGQLDEARLAGALRQVIDAMPALRVGVVVIDQRPVTVPQAGRPSVTRWGQPLTDEECVAVLRHERDRQPDLSGGALVRFLLLPLSSDETVLAIVADPLLLDLRSIYLVLGALLQAYLDRFRPAPYLPAAVDLNAPAATMPPARRAWWADRLCRWNLTDRTETTARVSGIPGAPVSATALRRLGTRWRQLLDLPTPGGNPGWLSLIAALVWWRSARSDIDRAAVLTSTLDLRDYLGLGPVAGPFTDRITFEVDLADVDRMTFSELVNRVHAGVLDTVVHYVPYWELSELGRELGSPPPPRHDCPWDMAVHYCPTPPVSARTKGEGSLAQRGLSIELFCESDLAAGGATTAPIDLYLAESDEEVALVANFDPVVVPAADVDELLEGIVTMVDSVATRPQVHLSRV